jgi:DNA-binding CsgD family transcriptional regulator
MAFRRKIAAMGEVGQNQDIDAAMTVMQGCKDATSLLTAFDALTKELGSIGLVGADYSIEGFEEHLLYSTLHDIFGPMADAHPQWYADDPAVARISEGVLRPFNFHDCWRDALSSAEMRIGEMQALGLHDGWTFPTSKPGFVGGIVLFASQNSAETMARNVPTLHVLCAYLHSYMTDIDPDADGYMVIRNTLRNRPIEGRRGKLSPREVTCLRWCALGKTAEEIATIEQISSHTVREYLRGAMRKLDSSTQAQAVARAMKYGVIRI